MKKTYLYTAIVTALFVTNISTVNAETANIQLKVDLKKEIKSNIPNAQTPMVKVPETNLSNVIEHVPDGIEDAAQGARDKAIADQSDLTPGLDTGSSLRDLNGGGNLAVGPSSRLKDPRSGNAMSGGRPSVATDPRTGKSLMGGGNGDSSTSNRDATRRGMAAGKGMASDGSEGETNYDTDVSPHSNLGDSGISFEYAVVRGDHTDKSSDGSFTTYQVTPGSTGAGRVEVSEWDASGKHIRTVTYEEGEKPVVETGTKPTPENTSTPTTSKADKQAAKNEIKKKKLRLQGRESYEDNGSNDQPAHRREQLTDLDLAGQPRPDDEGVSESATVGNIQDSGLLMSGQPTEEDDNFGAVGGRFSGNGIGNKNISDKLKQNTVSGVNQDIDVPKGGK